MESRFSVTYWCCIAVDHTLLLAWDRIPQPSRQEVGGSVYERVSSSLGRRHDSCPSDVGIESAALLPVTPRSADVTSKHKIGTLHVPCRHNLRRQNFKTSSFYVIQYITMWRVLDYVKVTFQLSVSLFFWGEGPLDYGVRVAIVWVTHYPKIASAMTPCVRNVCACLYSSCSKLSEYFCPPQWC